MRSLRVVIGVACSAILHAQAPGPAPAQAGLAPDWDVRPILQEMSAHAGRLRPVLDRIDVKSWVQKGASDTYQAQLESSKQQAKAIEDSAKALAQNPEKLSACLELYFRIQGLDSMLASLEEGIRKYQDPALAASLASLNAENGANRNRFQNYIVNLAADREQTCAVMDREAQRCRGMLATQAPSGTSVKRK